MRPSACRHTNRPSMIIASTVINTISHSLNRPRRDISSSAIQHSSGVSAIPVSRKPAQRTSTRQERGGEQKMSKALKRVQIITNTSRSSHRNYKETSPTRIRVCPDEKNIPTIILHCYTASRLQARSTVATLTAAIPLEFRVSARTPANQQPYLQANYRAIAISSIVVRVYSHKFAYAYIFCAQHKAYTSLYGYALICLMLFFFKSNIDHSF